MLRHTTVTQSLFAELGSMGSSAPPAAARAMAESVVLLACPLGPIPLAARGLRPCSRGSVPTGARGHHLTRVPEPIDVVTSTKV
jgi:hypothetical protein